MSVSIYSIHGGCGRGGLSVSCLLNLEAAQTLEYGVTSQTRVTAQPIAPYRCSHVSIRLIQGENPHTFDEILQDVQALRLGASVAVQECRTTLQGLAPSLIEVPVLHRTCEWTVNWIEMLVEALAPKGVVVAINGIVGTVADETEDA